jgi:hypothetical protein
MNRLLLLLTVTLIGASAGVAQSPEANLKVKLVGLIKDVQIQEAQMEENQKNIETKLADIGESVRVARIYAERSQ